MTSPVNLGFLVVLQDGTGYSGYYLVTSSHGRPLEFRLSSTVQPNKIQKALYAGTLGPYICGELIGKALVEKSSITPQLLLTTTEAALEVRRKIDLPVALLAPAEDVRPGGIALPGGQGKLFPHGDYPQDAVAIQALISQLAGSLSLAEPFERISLAMKEARSQGPTSRLGAA
jgi:hypothetical protein